MFNLARLPGFKNSTDMHRLIQVDKLILHIKLTAKIEVQPSGSNKVFSSDPPMIITLNHLVSHTFNRDPLRVEIFEQEFLLDLFPLQQVCSL